MTEVVAAAMAERAAAWVDSLDAEQRTVGAWPFPSDEERTRWFYTPTDHGGLPLWAMTARQQSLAMQLLAAGMSPAGYATVCTIMGLENVLDMREGFRMTLAGRERARHPGFYFVRVFGTPGPTGAWSWRFAGHHVSVHVLVVDGRVRSATPCFLGADPADVPLLGPHWLRPLGAVEDLGRELVRSLDDAQFASALISPVPPIDVVSANRARVSPGDGPLTLADVFGRELDERMAGALRARTQAEEDKIGFAPEHREAVRLRDSPAGVAASQLSAAQHEVLRALLDTYLGRMPDEVAEAEAAKYAGDGLHALHFAWAGGREKGQPHYYRVSGPRLLVEYDNTQNDVNHIHSVWRDPEGDFGHDVLAEHYRSGHHH